MVKLKVLSVTAKVVRPSQELLQGIVTINAKDHLNRYNLKSIRGLVSIDIPTQHGLFYADSLFFYGHSVDLAQNYYTPFPSFDPDLFRDRTIPKRNTKDHVIPYSLSIGYLSLPIETMRLSSGHHKLIDVLNKQTPRYPRGILDHNVSSCLKRLVKLALPSTDAAFKKYMEQHFTYYPLAFENLVVQSKSLYQTVQNTKNPDLEYLVFDSLSLDRVSGIPLWGEQYTGPFCRHQLSPIQDVSLIASP